MRVHKILPVLACLIVIMPALNAQSWVPGSNYVYTTGGVGIGTANPGATVHIIPAGAGDNGIHFNNAINGYSSIIWLPIMLVLGW